MNRGRKALTIPNIDWKVRIPSDLAATVELLLLDPVKEQVTYGARSLLIEELLRDWVDAKRSKENPNG